jgi:4-methoxybenzoate monooxygenase (O-demethylating)
MNALAKPPVEGAAVPVVVTDPYAPESLLDPHPFYEELREAGPVAWLPSHGVYAGGRHAEAMEVLTDFERFTASAGIGLQDLRKPGVHRPPNPILERDPPGHTAIRSAVMKIVSPAVVRGWREGFERIAEGVAEEVAKRAVQQPVIDGVKDVAETFVFRAFASVLGIEMQREATLAISEMSFNLAGPTNALRAASELRAAPYLAWYQQTVQREAMRSGSVGAQLYEAEDRGDLPPGVAQSTCRLLVRAGTDTTIAGIGFTLMQLALDPVQFQLVRDDPSRVKDAFEEAIAMNRLRTPTSAPPPRGACGSAA